METNTPVLWDGIWKDPATKEQDEAPPEYQGNPKTHGLKEPRGGGFNIMQHLQDDLVKEQYANGRRAEEVIAEIASIFVRCPAIFLVILVLECILKKSIQILMGLLTN